MQTEPCGVPRTEQMMNRGWFEVGQPERQIRCMEELYPSGVSLEYLTNTASSRVVPALQVSDMQHLTSLVHCCIACVREIVRSLCWWWSWMGRDFSHSASWGGCVLCRLCQSFTHWERFDKLGITGLVSEPVGSAGEGQWSELLKWNDFLYYLGKDWAFKMILWGKFNFCCQFIFQQISEMLLFLYALNQFR